VTQTCRFVGSLLLFLSRRHDKSDFVKEGSFAIRQLHIKFGFAMVRGDPDICPIDDRSRVALH
jgi:hypothetical protein